MGALFCEARYGSERYDATLAFRDALLRRPLGLEFTAEELALEPLSRHFAFVDGDLIVGTLVATPRDDGSIQLRQMAIAERLRGRGHGRRLFREAERVLAESGAGRLVLHARDTAVGFYEKLGFTAEGESFTELSIAHQKMVKRVSPS